jgi:hypothetical protein
MNIRKVAALGGALVVLGVAAASVTIVQAQTPTPTPTTRQNFADRYTQALATRLGVSVDKLKQAMQEARKEVGLPERGTRPAPGVRRGPGPGMPGNPGRPGGFGFGFGFPGLLGQQADAVAGLFNEDRAALLQELGGKTLAEVAAAHNVSTQDLQQTIVNTGNEQIDRLAQARNLSADQVSQMKQKMSERVQEFVTTHRFPARGSGIRS